MRSDFSPLAELYAATRPEYPEELFAWLAALAPGRALAWDAATGNGQAARGLARHFERVAATDLSARQLAQARRQPGIDYRVARSESSGLPEGAVDLVAAAAAIHWFDLSAFLAEARRVLRPGGVLAAWTYHIAHSEPPWSEILGPFYYEVTRPYFSSAVAVVDDFYETLDLGGDGLAPRDDFVATVRWNLAGIFDFVRSWSGVGRYRAEHGVDPVERIAPELARLWGPPETVRTVRWPLFLRAARF